MTLGPDDCPPATDTVPIVDRPGALVPEGPVDVVMCEKLNDAMPAGQREPVPRRQVTGAAARRFAALLNQGESDHPDVCALMKYGTAISFVLHYRDTKTVTVLVNQNCALLYSEGRTRFYGRVFSPVDEFLRSYRTVLAAVDPATIATPACAPTITAQRLNRQRWPSGPTDDVAVNRRSLVDGLLPDPVIAVVVCRYAVTTDGELVNERSTRTPADLRQIINRQARSTSSAPDVCGLPAPHTPMTLDTITVVDATAASLEVWLYRTPCTGVLTTGRALLVPDAGLLSFVDRLLGSPR